MPSPEAERLDVISGALARLIRQNEQFEQRLSRIEASLKLEAVVQAPVPPVLEPQPAPPPLPLTPSPLPQAEAESEPEPAPAVPAEVPTPPRGLESSIGLTLINRVGAVTLVLGIGFFFKWAVDNEWIGPSGRVILGILAGLATVGAGDYLWQHGQKTFAQGVTAVGTCILYLAIYAAYAFYHLAPQSLAFIAMAVTTAMAGALALRYGAVAIAALGLFGGFLTPLLLSSGENRPWFLFSYILLLDIGALALMKARRWRLLEILSFIGTVLISVVWFFNFKRQDQFVATLFTLIFYGLFAYAGSFQGVFLVAQLLTALAVSVVWSRDLVTYFALAILVAACGLAVADLRRWRGAVSVAFTSFWIWSGLFYADFPNPKPVEDLFLGFTCGFLLFLAWIPWWFMVRRESPRTQDLGLLALNGAAYFGASYYLLNPSYHAWMGLFAVALAGIHLALGYALWRRQPEDQRDLTPILLTLGVALGFLTLAAPIQLTAWRITMAWSLEAAALSWIGVKLRSARMIIAGAAVFFLAFIRLMTIDSQIYPTAAGYSLLMNQRFLTFAITAVCLWLAAWWVERPKELRLVYYLAGHFVLLWTFTQEVLGWANRSTAVENLLSVETISVSILYAIYAVALVSLGVGTRTAINRISGLILIGGVVLKLYVFDVWQLGRLYRTLAFVALGILLLSTSFLYSHFRSLIETWWKNDEAAT